MRRRDFVALFGVACAAGVRPAAVRAQEAGRKYRIAALTPSPRGAPTTKAMFDELREFGFVEGQNLTIDHRAYGQRIELLSKYAEELFGTLADVIVAAGDPAIRPAQAAAKTTSILAITDDMVGSGFVSSLAKPTANTTGVSMLSADLDGKRQEILKEAVPGIRRMAALADVNTTGSQQLQEMQNAARAREFEVAIYPVAKQDEIIPAIDTAKKSDADALNILASPLFFANRQTIIERVAALGLPAMYQWPELAEEGGFLAYGPRLVAIFRDTMARQLVKLLRGASPTDVPIEQPTKFELVINMKTAQLLGVQVSRSMQLLADEVIE